MIALTIAPLLAPLLFTQATTEPPASIDAAAFTPARHRDAAGRILPSTPERHPSIDWWNSAVFYQVFVRSFQDSTEGPLANDGIGDFPGLTSRLDDIKDLGVDALWLMPIHPSPSYHGYDIADYTAIHPDYGTLDDFKHFLAECRKRNIRVILDLVINHTARTHPWFQAALNPADPRHDWYIWVNDRPAYRGPWGQQVWHPLNRPAQGAPPAGPFYYGLFSREMPDLNFRNPQVTQAILDVTRFWLEAPIGVDGYRLDAIRHLIEDGPQQDNTPETHRWLEQFYTTYKAANPQALAVGEVWASTEIASSYVGSGASIPGPGQMDLTFEFDLAGAMIAAARDGRAAGLIAAQEKVLRFFPPGQYGRFLSNHDQTRVASELKSDPGKLRVAAALLLTGPGVPFIYYAEELGQPGTKPDPRLRTPMPWLEPGKPRGPNDRPFTTAKPLDLPPNQAWSEPFPAPPGTSVQAQRDNPTSLRSFYQQLIALRRRHPALAWGDLRILTADHPALYATLRTAGDDAAPVLVIVNLSSQPVATSVIATDALALTGTFTGTDALAAKTEPAAKPLTLTLTPEGLAPLPLPPLEPFQVMVIPFVRER
jgi:glycosidase